MKKLPPLLYRLVLTALGGTLMVLLLVAIRPPLPAPEALLGTWQVDLRPTPEAEPYFQTLVITSVADGQLQGTFYGGTPVQHGRVNDDWETLHFAFVTEDGSGAYHTTGRLVGDRLEGSVHAIGRGFLSVWTAERKP